jgi:hypothetical protein
MLRRTLLLATVSGLIAMEAQPLVGHGQSPPTEGQASIRSIKQAIASVTGYNAESIELTATSQQLVVTIVNSKLIAESGRVRESEAARIVEATVREMTSKSELKNVQAIHIDYVSREADGSHSRTIDAIDFRRTPQGAFEHHIT